MIGVGYARNGQPERGLASCNTAIAINPNNDCAYVCAGLTNMAQAHSDQTTINGLRDSHSWMGPEF